MLLGMPAACARQALAAMGAATDLRLGAVPIGHIGRAMSLFGRVLLANAAVLAIATLLLLFTPIEISFPVTNTQAAILVTGFVISVILNMLLLRGVIAPLRRLTDTMRAIEPLNPGRRLTIRGADADVAALATAFNEMLDRLETERRESGRRELLAQEAERQRIARELHDEVGQVLTGVVLELEHAARNAREEGAPQLVAAREAVRRSLDDVRRIARELRPEVLDDLGLQSALRSLCTAAAAHDDLRVERRFELRDPVSPEVELVVYRVAQESLTNVMRHADASEVLVALGTVDGGLRLVVRDNGRGMPERRELGAGIAGMQERALHVGGRLTVAPAASGGTEVRLDIPLPEGPA
jgi:two-component system, NarL family, sensor histidine kinase UhpB